MVAEKLFVNGIAILLTELKKTKTDLATMKKQSESTNAEYDRLAEEHQKLVVSLGSYSSLYVYLL